MSSYMDLVIQDLAGIRSAGDIRSQLGVMSRVSTALTERELEILRMLGEGLENKVIAYDLEISEQTVKNHVTAILQKLNVGNRLQAVMKAHNLGYISKEDTRFLDE